MTQTKKTADRIRKLLVSKFGSGIFNVTTTNRGIGVGSVFVKFSTQKIPMESVVGYLRDNGHDNFMIFTQTKDMITLFGYISEHNYSIAVFA